MYVFAYLRLNLKRHDFVMRLPIKAQIRTSKKRKRTVRSHD